MGDDDETISKLSRTVFGESDAGNPGLVARVDRLEMSWRRFVLVMVGVSGFGGFAGAFLEGFVK